MINVLRLAQLCSLQQHWTIKSAVLGTKRHSAFCRTLIRLNDQLILSVSFYCHQIKRVNQQLIGINKFSFRMHVKFLDFLSCFMFFFHSFLYSLTATMLM